MDNAQEYLVSLNTNKTSLMVGDTYMNVVVYPVRQPLEIDQLSLVPCLTITLPFIYGMVNIYIRKKFESDESTRFACLLLTLYPGILHKSHINVSVKNHNVAHQLYNYISYRYFSPLVTK